MKSTSLSATFVISLLIAGGFATSAQQTKTGQAEKAPIAPQAEKKRSIVVFPLKGTVTPVQKPERPKGVPRFEPLSAAEKLKIVSGVPGLPNLTNTIPTPFLTLTVDHLEDPAGYLTLNWPDRVFFPLAHYANNIPCDDFRCGIALVNQGEYVQVDFQAEGGNVYMVDFFIDLDVVPADFQLTLGGVTSPPVTANVGGNDLLTWPVYVPVQIVVPPLHPPPGPPWLTATLRLAPRSDNRPYPNWGPYYFIAAEVSKFVSQ